MPGSFIFRPVEAHLTHNTELIGKMNPYCQFQVGSFVAKSAICKKGGKNPHWDDIVTIPAPKMSDAIVNIHVMDKDRFTKDDVIGTMSLDMNQLKADGRTSKWYPIYHNNKPAGEILMESMFDGVMEREANIITEHKDVAFVEEKAVAHTAVTGFEPEVKVFQEQRQVVEPRTFLKEVDVVETRSVMQNIEVMEPVKVIKDVEYTEVVPVKKQIETIEPQVVKKQVEVIEPRLVTKTIQVVENVPVMKEVEVIESIPVIQEVETFEPRTFTKQVEVIEQVPVMKQVEVTEPVHLKKAVEFVEPVITTQTITKEVREPVIVSEEITTSVGPATVIHDVVVTKDKKIEKEIIESDILHRNKF